MAEVAGSKPASSTFREVLITVGELLGGFVAGEGWFVETARRPRTPTRRFVFGVTVADRDRPLLEALRQFLGCGSIRHRRPRDRRWLPQAVFTVSSHRQHAIATIPFAERFLPAASAKRDQFHQWRARLLAYEAAAGRAAWGSGGSVCSVEGCGGRVRGRGKCRRHYYEETGW